MSSSILAILKSLMKQQSMEIKLQRVYYMPKELKPGVLYVSEEYATAAHLCPCGCNSKIRTPLGPTDWTFEETDFGPTLWPSIGNWQRPCQSHYWIIRGQVKWADKWTPEQIASGRKAEELRRLVYYDTIERKRRGILRKSWFWLKELVRRK